ncbi:MAG: hypothetical protein R3C97_12575 [Geminicoccaceae bacterium]
MPHFTGQLDEARGVLGGAPPAIANHASIAGASAALELAREAGDLGDPRELEVRIERDADHEAHATPCNLALPARPAC